jgi:hypothetical protein
MRGESFASSEMANRKGMSAIGFRAATGWINLGRITECQTTVAAYPEATPMNK